MKLRPLDIKKLFLMSESPRWTLHGLARYFGVDRATVRYHLKKYNLSK